MKLFFDDTSFDAQLQRTAAKAAYGCADLGEIFAIARRITEGDLDSWHHEWFGAAERLRELAEAESAAGRRVNARAAHLRSSECYRSAYFFCRRDLDGDALQTAWRRSRETFRAALPDLPLRVEPVHIPFEDTHLEGYVVHAVGGSPAPTVLLPSGYDSPVEESWSLGAVEAATRGFNVVTFSGPGQAEMLYEHRIPFRPEFEQVVAAVLATVESRDDLDDRRVGIVGRSFGGYLAPRAAAHEPRLAALAADPAQTDMGALLASRLPADVLALVDADDPAFDDLMFQLSPGPAGEEFWMSRAVAHGLDSPLEYVKEMRRYVVDVEAITAPTFVSYGEGDFAEGTTREFFDRLRVEDKQFSVYREADGGGGHCEGMGPSRYFNDVFGWLATRLSSDVS